MKIIFRVLIIVSILVLVSYGCSTCSWFANGVAGIVDKELSPGSLNNKYGWFKDAYARIDSFNANIAQLTNKIRSLEGMYKDVKRTDWASSDISSYNQWLAERDGVIAAHNRLAAEYNSEMSKWHTAFTNAGNLPVGGTGIPREVQPYTSDVK